VLFGSGYLANIGVVSSLAKLAGEGAVVYSDELNHASLIDGLPPGAGRHVRLRHCDVEHLAWGLKPHRGRPGVIATDSVFSMDGDVAPLAELVELAQRHGLRTVVDEATAPAAWVRAGAARWPRPGSRASRRRRRHARQGARRLRGVSLAVSAAMRDYLTNTARSLIFSTALPPPAVAGALAALEVLQEHPEMVDKLQANAGIMRDELGARGDSRSPGSSNPDRPAGRRRPRPGDARLREGDRGRRLRPGDPAADRPAGTSRLRLALMATHTREELRAAARTLGRAALQAGFRPGAGVPLAAAQPPGHPDERLAPGEDATAAAA